MSWTSAIAIYFILWWLVLFTVLPWGSESAHETGTESASGHAPSAPLNPRLAWKFAITTALSAIVFAVVYWPIHEGWLTIDSIPFLPTFEKH
ncbi:MAG: DUF1467 family protein [Parvibaculaceae bacterium]